MNDRNKFRVWCSTAGEYIDTLCDDCYVRPDGIVECSSFVEDSIGGHYEGYAQNEIEIEWCTGVRDSKNTLIYEGDIVEFILVSDPMISCRGKIYWNKEDASYFIYVSFDEEYGLYGQKMKVIGNIHENIEALD